MRPVPRQVPLNIGETLSSDIPLIQGMHANEIARRSGVGSQKLSKYPQAFRSQSFVNILIARILRYLASSHIFEELSPDVFANNLLSSLLDTGKPADAIKDDHG